MSTLNSKFKGLLSAFFIFQAPHFQLGAGETLCIRVEYNEGDKIPESLWYSASLVIEEKDDESLSCSKFRDGTLEEVDCTSVLANFKFESLGEAFGTRLTDKTDLEAKKYLHELLKPKGKIERSVYLANDEYTKYFGIDKTETTMNKYQRNL